MKIVAKEENKLPFNVIFSFTVALSFALLCLFTFAASRLFSIQFVSLGVYVLASLALLYASIAAAFVSVICLIDKPDLLNLASLLICLVPWLILFFISHKYY